MRKPPVSERFLQAFDDPALFAFGEINLLKVVQDALLREVGYKKTRWPHTWFNRPRWMLQIMFWAKRTLKGPPHFKPDPAVIDRSLMAIVPPRFVPDQNGQMQLQYMGKIFNHIPRKEMVLMYVSPTDPMPVIPDMTKEMADEVFSSALPDNEEWEFLKALKGCFQNIEQQGRFSETELLHIRVGLDEFWQNYRAMDHYLRLLNIRKALLIPGYYMDFLIAALKKHGVEVIELQHGVITPASHFYIYPKKIGSVVKRALFPDRIWLFGAFWKQQLEKGVGFEASQMEVLGDYFVRHAEPPKDPKRLQTFTESFPEIVLVGTQTKRHAAFIELVKDLSDKYMTHRPKTGIVLKPHPAEDPALYSDLEKFPNVMVTAASLDFLYPLCRVYIGMYSNTLFEATRFEQLGIFVLRTDETAELTDGIAASGVAQVLKRGDDPMAMLSGEGVVQKQPADYFFQQELNTELLKELKTN